MQVVHLSYTLGSLKKWLRIQVYVSISLENKFDDPVLTPPSLGANIASVAANMVSNENPFYLSGQERCLGPKSHIPRPQIPAFGFPIVQ